MKYSLNFFISCLLFSSMLAFSNAAPMLTECPQEIKDLPIDTKCWKGKDEAGAFYWIAKPKKWNGNLVLHAHGGPSLGQAKLERATEDFKRWSIWVRDGYAFATTSFRQGGVEVMAAADDMVRLLPIAIEAIGKTQKIILHGQSWGAGVVARAAEIEGPFSKMQPNIDAVLLTSGVLAGGTKSYDFRLDLRTVWQALCENHPRPQETQYPLWQGFPKGATLSKSDLTQRVNECLGLDKPDRERTDKQRENIKTIVNVIKIPEDNIQGHLSWGTNHFQDIVFNRLNGRNPFGNDTVKYVGSANDEWLNQKVLRYKADATAISDFGKDADPTGNIALPMIAVRGTGDPIAFVELASAWEDTVTKAGYANNLLQLYTDDKDHSYLSDAQYISAMNALLKWVDSQKKPTPHDIMQQCVTLDKKWNPHSDCRFLPDYQPAPLSARVPAR